MSLLNKVAPLFTLPSTEDKNVSLSDYKNQKVLLVFYPGDDTPVCTKQLCSYADGFEEFKIKNVVILGINKDNLESHKKFKAKHNLPFPVEFKSNENSSKIISAEKISEKLGLSFKHPNPINY